MNKNLTIGIVVLLLLGLGGYFMISNSTINETVTDTQESMVVDLSEETSDVEEMITDEDLGTEAGEELEILITASDFQFNPNTFTVEAGQQVVLTLNSSGMPHDIVFEDLDVRTEIIMSGNSETITFTAPDEPGEYAYYCSVGNHRALGMEGVMIVE